MVQPLNKLDLLFKSMNAEVRFPHREAAREGLYMLAVLRLKPFAEPQRFYLRQGKVDGVEAAILPRALRETLRDVGHPIEIVVMEHHQPIVFGHHQVLLKIIGALSVGHRFCRQRMLRQIAAGAPVGDDKLIRRSGGKAQSRTGQ